MNEHILWQTKPSDFLPHGMAALSCNKLCTLTGFGAFVHYDDEPVRGDVKGWNVHTYKVGKLMLFSISWLLASNVSRFRQSSNNLHNLASTSAQVSKSKRHMDGLAVSQFWLQLADWLKVHKPLYLQPVHGSSSSAAAEAGAARK